MYYYDYKIKPLALSRSNDIIAGEVSIEVSRLYELLNSEGPFSISCPIYILPAPDIISMEEAITLILQDFLDISAETPPPIWIDEYPFPGEEKEIKYIESLKEQKSDIKEEISVAQNRLEELIYLKSMLFETGESLEMVVWNALERLGVEVHESEVEGREDRWFETHDGKAGCLEIKGRIHGLKLDDVRQAEHWSSVLDAGMGREIKGFLIGNPFRHVIPRERDNPWQRDLKDYAKRRHITLISTTQLFEVLRLVEQNSIDPIEFFNIAFESNGPIDLKLLTNDR